MLLLVQIMGRRLVGVKPLYEPLYGLLLIGLLKTNFADILIEMHTCSFKKMH